MSVNLILLTDSYKVSHYKQYPLGTEVVYSFFESRGGKWDEVVFFGLQYFIKKYLRGPVLNFEKIMEARDVFKLHFGSDDLFNNVGWVKLLEKHKGRLPIKIKAVPEGTVVPTKNVLMTVENTDEEFPWLTNYLETLLTQIWYPCTVATQSREMKKIIKFWLEESGDPAGIDFKLHDFGFRGVSSVETAGIGGAAHLVNFLGTDTLAGILTARKYYNAEMPGFSIPAAEHSTITSWGRNNEESAFGNMLYQYPKGLVAVVSDSYDIYHACEKIWGEYLRSSVLNRDGTLVVRPDSGYPPEVVLKVLEILGSKFGYSTNKKGYKVLNPKVRVIQGDGIDIDMLSLILDTMAAYKWSADNLAFGSGGGLLQKLNRDTLKFAFKCSAIKIDGDWRDVFKDPVTDKGKQSKKGRLKLVKDNEGFHTYTYYPDQKENDSDNWLETVFEDGSLVKEYSFDEIRERAKL